MQFGDAAEALNLSKRKVTDTGRDANLAGLTYGALCRGLLSGKLQENTPFGGDDLRFTNPNFQRPRFAQYLAAVRRLDQFARDHVWTRLTLRRAA